MRTRSNTKRDESEKKRKRDGREDSSPAAEGGAVGAARDSMMAEVRALLEESRSQILAQVQERTDALERRCEELEKKSKAQQERCRLLEAKCESLGRSVHILPKDQMWVYSAPDIPTGYWEGRDYIINDYEEEAYIPQIEMLIDDMKRNTNLMRFGKHVTSIELGDDGELSDVLLYDEALLSHWQEFMNALHLCDLSGELSIAKVQLPSLVLEMLPSTLAMKKVTSLAFDGNDFTSASNGIQFAVALIKCSRYLECFKWMNNPIIGMNEVDDLLEVIISHPTLNRVCLGNSFQWGVNGYDVLCSLLTSRKIFLEIDLETSYMATKGRTDIPDFLATNPPLQDLNLDNNHLDDDDAVRIADALKRNTNLQFISLQNNRITNVGWVALRNAVFDSACLNSMADCNHTCRIFGLFEFDDTFRKNDNSNPDCIRGSKLHHLLTAKYHEKSILNDLDLEFRDDALKFAPNVLECVHIYSGYLPHRLQRPAQTQTLSFMFDLLRGWQMPELFEGHTH